MNLNTQPPPSVKKDINPPKGVDEIKLTLIKIKRVLMNHQLKLKVLKLKDLKKQKMV